MPKYDIVKASSYDPAALAEQLTAKSADGWEVVAIVPTGGDVTAFIRHDGDPDSEAKESPMMAAVSPPDTEPDAESEKPAEEASAAYTPEPVSEPAGWGVAPDSSSEAAKAAAPIAPISEPSSSAAPATVTMYSPAASATPAAAAATPPSAAVPSVPAGWYADPSGRYEQRYWDGGTWTEHVARGGAQFTDPPVA